MKMYKCDVSVVVYYAKNDGEPTNKELYSPFATLLLDSSNCSSETWNMFREIEIINDLDEIDSHEEGLVFYGDNPTNKTIKEFFHEQEMSEIEREKLAQQEAEHKEYLRLKAMFEK